MRILFFSNVYPLPWQPGRGVFNQRLVMALRAAGHDVHVVVPVNVAERATNRGSRTHSLSDATYIQYLVPPKVLRHRYHQLGWPFLRGTLRRLMRQIQPDVILAFWIHPDAAIAQRLGDEFGVPVVPMAGGSDIMVITRDARRRAAVERVLRRAPAVLTNGTALRTAAIALGADPQRTHVFRRGVDTSVFNPGDRDAARQELGILPTERLLLFVGNLVPVKGPDLLVDALSRCAAGAPWTVAWVGDGPMRAAIETSSAAASMAGRMRFPGRLDAGALAVWYRAADAIALPSRSEGIPNVLIEAAACGTPFVAFDVGGVREIEADHSRIVPANDVAAFSAALVDAYVTPARTSGAAPTAAAMVDQVIGALTLAVQERVR